MLGHLAFASASASLSPLCRGFDLVWEHLTPEVVDCYWRELLWEYSSLLKWTIVRDPSLEVIWR